MTERLASFIQAVSKVYALKCVLSIKLVRVSKNFYTPYESDGEVDSLEQLQSHTGKIDVFSPGNKQKKTKKKTFWGTKGDFLEKCQVWYQKQPPKVPAPYLLC